MFSLFLPVGILIGSGLVILSALSFHSFVMELVWILVGVGFIFLFYFIDWRTIFNLSWLVWGIYIIGVLLMILSYIQHSNIRNTSSWLVLGPITIQPVELVKIALIFLYASYFSRRHITVARWKTIFFSFLLFIIPAAIAVKLPDLGSVVIFGGIWLGFLLLSGLPFKRILVGIIVIILSAGLLWTYVFRGYHRERILGFFSQQQNSLGINYSIIQSKIAIGSAGLFGKGYGQGTQAQLSFLSVPTEDFIFSAFTEEWGIVGGIIIVVTFLFMIYKILSIGILADKNFEKFICLGAAIMFIFQFLLNVGSATGLTPVVGVTFPFFSYGGSSMIADFFLIAVINSIRRRSLGSI